MKILFLETPLPQDGNRGQFAAGEVHDLRPDSAQHWLSRGVATDEPKKIAAAEPVPERVGSDVLADLMGDGAASTAARPAKAKGR